MCLTFPSLFSIILSLQHLSLYYGLTFSNCLPFPWSRYCFPPTSHIFHKCLTLSIYTSHFPHTSHIIHKCFPFSTNASIFHTYFTFSTNTCVPFSFFYFHAHSTVASLCSYIGASLRVINTSIAPQGGYNQSIHRFLAVNKKRQRHNQRLGYKSLKIFLWVKGWEAGVGMDDTDLSVLLAPPGTVAMIQNCMCFTFKCWWYIM